MRNARWQRLTRFARSVCAKCTVSYCVRNRLDRTCSASNWYLRLSEERRRDVARILPAWADCRRRCRTVTFLFGHAALADAFAPSGGVPLIMRVGVRISWTISETIIVACVRLAGPPT